MKILLEIRGVPGPGARIPVTRKTITADWIRVGRDAACEVHLPDPRMPLAQGMIVERSGLVYIEGEGGSQDITRKAVRSVRLNPGEPIDLGPYRMQALPAPEGYDGALSVQLVRLLATAEDLASRTSRTTLAATGLSKRTLAWVLGLAALAFALVIPAGRVLHLPWRAAAAETAIGDRLWNPGPLTLAHQPIQQQCSACHKVAFQRVSDGACLECHKTVGDHIAPGLRSAALFSGARCEGCHREHKGIRSGMRDDDDICVACHRDLHARAPSATARDAADFATAHPAFRVSIREGDRLERVRQGAGPILHPTGLRFPHDKHLDPKGVRSPSKGRVTLHCDACHHPDASARAFEPVSMARDCQSCHRLQFEPAVTSREVPHGKPGDAAQVIEEFYANLALKGERDSFERAFGVPGEGLLRRVGAPDDAQRANTLRLASRKARKVTQDLFEVRVCKTCHQVTRDAATPSPSWRVKPVATTQRLMPHARFDHRAHQATRCGECHDVERSKSVDAVAMPSIETCRKCHGGSKPVAKKVTSNCLLCHAFHDVAHLPGTASAERTALAR